jgi:hypothetical protein
MKVKAALSGTEPEFISCGRMTAGTIIPACNESSFCFDNYAAPSEHVSGLVAQPRAAALSNTPAGQSPKGRRRSYLNIQAGLSVLRAAARGEVISRADVVPTARRIFASSLNSRLRRAGTSKPGDMVKAREPLKRRPTSEASKPLHQTEGPLRSDLSPQRIGGEEGLNGMDKPKQNQDAVIRLLEQNGWSRDEENRIPACLIVRPRFHKPETDLWATVGPKTTCFYSKREVDGREPDVAFLSTIPTADITAAADFLATCERPW